MKPVNIKDRCTKKCIKKCEEVVRLYDEIQLAYASVLEKNTEIEKIKCNVPTVSIDDNAFMSDFVCTKTNGDIMVRECVHRNKLSLPRTAKLLDASRKYWTEQGVTDWGIVIGKEVRL